MLAPGDGVVLDFGGVYDGYCVDLTRTVQLGARQRMPSAGLFEAVREAQRGRDRGGAAGRPASAVDAAAREVLAGAGWRRRSFTAPARPRASKCTRSRGSRGRAAARDEILEPGMVFTVEPGAYVPGVGGVRIEDDVLVTATGARC